MNDGQLARLQERFPNRRDAGFYIDIPPGWEPVVCCLDAVLSMFDPDYQILQIKEKFGGLRYYTSHAHNEACGGLHSDDSVRDCKFFRAVDQAEQQAATMCEMCGQPGTLRHTPWAWMHTACDQHAPEL